MNEANGMQWWNWRGAVGVGTSSSADDAALNSRQSHGYKSWLDLERIPLLMHLSLTWFLLNNFDISGNSSGDDAALNSRQSHGYKSRVDLERILHIRYQQLFVLHTKVHSKHRARGSILDVFPL